MTKAIIGIANFRETANELMAVAARLDTGERLPSVDYQLNFATASQLFSELTPKRLELLDTLKRTGPQSVYRLAKILGRNYSNVHSSVACLLDLGLIARNDDDKVYVPWDDVEIHVSLSGSIAA
jgi:predicted transcriptional regulator